MSRVVAWAALVTYIVFVLRRAWMCDDAFITLRAVGNVFSGQAFAFNPDERVLGFTNPLWAVVAIPFYALTHDPYITGMALGLTVSACFAAFFVFGRRTYRLGASIVLLALCLSRAFVDFSTSGLENPLSHLIVLLTYGYFLTALRPSALVLGLALAVGWINRIDGFPLLVWPLVWVLLTERSRAALRQSLAGVAIILVFEFVLFFYYGFVLPNTVYAKLNSEIPPTEFVLQGVAYLFDSLSHDPITIGLLMAGVGAAVFCWKRERNTRVIAAGLGIVAHVTYVVAVGGDFMSGRFLTPAVVLGAILLAHCIREIGSRPHAAAWLGAGLAGLAMTQPFSPWRPEQQYDPRLTYTGIVSERVIYERWTSLELNFRRARWRDYGYSQDIQKIRDSGHHAVVMKAVGMLGVLLGPVHVVDEWGLTDPLLARLPFGYRPDWRPGHLERTVPEGYLETTESGQNRVQDPCLKAYYAELQLVTRGSLWDVRRLTTAFLLNLPGHFTVRPCSSPPGQH